MLDKYICANRTLLVNKLNELFPESFELDGDSLYFNGTMWNIRANGTIEIGRLSEAQYVIFVDNSFTEHFLNVVNTDITFNRRNDNVGFGDSIGVLTYFKSYNENDVIMTPSGYMTSVLNDELYSLSSSNDPLYLPSGNRTIVNSTNLMVYGVGAEFNNNIELSPLYIGCCKMLNLYVGNNPANCGFEITIDSKKYTCVGRNLWYGE